MSAHVTGRSPSAPVGRLFLANHVQWIGIHMIGIDLYSDLMDGDTLWKLGWHRSCGPENQETCTRMADRIDRWLDDRPLIPISEAEADTEVGTTIQRRLKLTDWLWDPENIQIPENMPTAHVMAWIEFLRHCGGAKFGDDR